MIRSLLSGLLASFLALALPAQNLSIKGEVMDYDTMAFPGVRVQLFNEKAGWVKGKLSNLAGEFQFDSLSTGSYRLLLTASGHDTLEKPLFLSERHPNWGLGRLYLLPTGFEIGGVEITSEIQAISLKGDTVEFNADAFVVKPHHKVGDLLHQLPGLEIENGVIMAHGEPVTRILVDGKEFYGSEVKDALESLPAEVIGKVQLYDKSSEEAEFLGIEDQDKEKTLNLKLKKITKGSFFGEVKGTAGTQNRYRAGGSVNRYVGSTQFSVTGRSFNQVEEAPELADRLNQRHSPLALHLVTRLGKKIEYDANYRYVRTFTHQGERRTALNDLDSLTYLTESVDSLRQFRQVLQAKNDFDFNPDSLTRISLWTTVDFQPSEQTRWLETTSLLEGNQVNVNQSRNQTEQKLSTLNLTYKYLRKTKKEGRSFIVRGRVMRKAQPSSAELSALNADSSGAVYLVDTLDQLQYGDLITFRNTGEVKYNENWKPHIRTNFSLIYELERNQTDREFLDISGGEAILNPNLSDAYKNALDQYQAKGVLFWSNGDLSGSVSAVLLHTRLNGTAASAALPLEKSWINFLPRVLFEWKPPGKGSFRADYRTEIRLPELWELQSIPDNSNPQQIYVGNPDLRPAFTHSLAFRYLTFYPKVAINWNSSLFFNYTQNEILQASIIDPEQGFLQVSRPENLGETFKIMWFGNGQIPIRPAKLAIEMWGNLHWRQSPTSINLVIYPTDRLSSAGKIALKTYKVKAIQAEVGLALDLTRTHFSLGDQSDRRFINTSLFGEVTYDMGTKWSLNALGSWFQYQGGTLDAAQIPPFLKLKIARIVFKNKRGRVELEGYDLLDRQIRVQRLANLNYLEERRIQYPGRVILLGFSYQFRIGSQENQE